jgi:hypothetical protein
MKKLLVILLAVAMVGAFTLPAMAASTFSFKGDARMDTYMVNQDDDLGPAGESDDDLYWTKQNVLSRLGIKATNENITGYIEIRPNVGSFVRHWFGEWNFGSGKLLVGKTWTPATVFTNASNYRDNIMGRFGNMNWAAARIDQLRLTLLDGNLKIGFLSPNTPALTGYATNDTDTTLPTVEAAYTLKFDPVKLILCGGYASYDVVDAADDSETVTSNFFGFAAFANFGAAYVKAEAHMSTNEGNYGMNGSQNTDTSADYVAGDVEDNKGLGYQLIVGFKASDTMTVEAGYGFISGEDDSADDPDEASMMYVNLPISLAAGVTLTPEVGVIDYMDDDAGNAEGKETFYGATWKISF